MKDKAFTSFVGPFGLTVVLPFGRARPAESFSQRKLIIKIDLSLNAGLGWETTLASPWKDKLLGTDVAVGRELPSF